MLPLARGAGKGAAGKTVLLKNAPGAVQKTMAEQLKGGGALHKLSVEVVNGRPLTTPN